MKLALGIVLLGSVAHAAPLAQKYREPGCPVYLHRVGSELVSTDRKAHKILRFDAATGKPLPAIKSAAVKAGSIVDSAGDTLLVYDGKTFVAVDAATGKQRWKTVAKSWTVIAGDFAFATDGKAKTTVVRLDGKTGAKKWSTDVPAIGTSFSFKANGTQILATSITGKAISVSVLDGQAGTIAWTSTLAIKTNNGALLGGNAVVVQEETRNGAGSAFHILDIATGKPVGRVEYANAFHPVVGADRVFIGWNDLDKKLGTVLAIDTKTGKQLWTQTSPLMVHSIDAIAPMGLLVDLGHGLLRVMDPQTGKVTSTFGLPSSPNLELGTNPAIITCDDKDIIGLDPGGTDSTAKVTGKVVCSDCDLAKLPVRIGDVATTTDDKGAFSITITGAGRFEVDVDYETDAGIIGGTGKFITLPVEKPVDIGTVTVAAPVLGD